MGENEGQGSVGAGEEGERGGVSRRRLATLGLSVAAAGYVTQGQGAQAANATVYPPVDWLNVKTAPYSAVGDGVADDTAHIQSALDAAGAGPEGGVVYLPAGTYVTTGELTIPPTVTLQGSHGNRRDATTAVLRPSAGFSGVAVIRIVDKVTGNYSRLSNEQRIFMVNIDGSMLPKDNTVDGILLDGYVHSCEFADIRINDVGGNGLTSKKNSNNVLPSYSHRGTRMLVTNTGAAAYGFNLSMTDCTWTDLQAIGGHGGGFFIGGAANSHFTNCRAEWSGTSTHGFTIGGTTGTSTGSGGMTFTGCSTDRNEQHGFHITSQGNAPIIFTGCMTRRDGRNGKAGGGDLAGFNIDAAATAPIIINGLTCYPGIEDGSGGGTNSPDYGLRIAGAATVHVDNAYLHAQKAGLANTGTNVRLGSNLTYASGATNSTNVQSGGTWTVRKTASTAKTNNTPAPDPHLTTNVPVSSTFNLRCVLFMDGPNSNNPAGFSYNFTLPSGSTITSGHHALATTAVGPASNLYAQATATGAPLTVGLAGAGTKTLAIIEAVLTTDSTSGPVTLQWSQGTTNANNPVTLYAGSTMTLQQIA